jgi:two-component system response regulator CpxR
LERLTPALSILVVTPGGASPQLSARATFGAVRLLLIDDDTELCSLLAELLKREGFAVECINEGRRGLDRALNGGFNLVILDVMLPALDGFEILRRLRKESRVPVLMLTARADDVDRIVGLELGADDYLPKPFNPRELVARVRAILRRYEPRTSVGARLAVNGVALDPATRQVTVDGEAVDLTTFEFDILDLLMRAAGRVLSRDDLMENLYNRQATAFDRSIDMHVSHIRRKLETKRPFIKTIRGVGYQFLKSPQDEAAE